MGADEAARAIVAPVQLSDRPESWKTSAVYLAGLGKALRGAGLLEQVAPRLSVATRRIIDNPYGERWHPASHSAELCTVVLEQFGPQTLEDIAFVVSRDSFGPILGPMLKVALTLSGVSPATIFGRINQSLMPVVQGVSATWRSDGAQSGVVAFEYPMVAPPFTEVSWRGGLRFMFLLVGLEGTIAPCERLEGGRVLRFAVSWK